MILKNVVAGGGSLKVVKWFEGEIGFGRGEGLIYIGCGMPRVTSRGRPNNGTKDMLLCPSIFFSASSSSSCSC